ncbi:MAG: TonB-dependent receptor [Desulfobacterales bacterium]|nr:TonB-dependent receptor [Desulfobacterales bacterium]
MNRRKKYFVVGICLLLVQAAFSEISMAREKSTEDISPLDDLLSMSLEELMSVEVVTAGRQAQKISEAPAALSVVTAEDIKQLGATQLGEALRMVVGIHFGYTNSSYMAAGGIRGFHKLPANKIVLLIDGVPWSLEIYGIPLLSAPPISLDEIERIEVLRGPGSSLYGSNAMFGVINVITKKTEDTKGNLISFIGGEQQTLIGTYMHGGSIKDNINYRVTLGWDQRDNRDYVAWSNEPVQQISRINTTWDYHLNDNSQFSLFAAYVDTMENDFICESTGPIDYTDGDHYRTVLAFASKDPGITIRAHMKRQTRNNGSSFGQKVLDFEMGTTGVEVQHTWELFKRDTLVWGANFTQEYADGPLIGGERTHDMAGVFIDNTYKMRDNTDLNAGLRYDDHPNTGGTVSHRLSLQYAPYEKHNFRLTCGSSYRNPDFIESYYDRTTPYGAGQYLHVYGQEDNDPEKASTYELAYSGQLTEKFFLGANLFHSEIEDFIYFAPSGTPYFDPGLGGMVIPYAHQNLGDAKQHGGELELKYQITDYLTGTVNYTYLKQEVVDAAVEQLLVMTPQHMANAQLRARLKNGFSANLTIHYKSSTEWREYTWPHPDGNTVAGGKADNYVFANLRVGYDFTIFDNDAEIALACFNLLDEKFDDYPLDTSDVARRVTGSFSLRF